MKSSAAQGCRTLATCIQVGDRTPAAVEHRGFDVADRRGRSGESPRSWTSASGCSAPSRSAGNRGGSMTPEPNLNVVEGPDGARSIQINARGLAVLDDPQVNRGTAF